jgi:predicted dehydrogenase
MKKIKAGIIGFGIGQKHFEAIQNYKNSEVKIICEKNLNKF